MKDILYNRVKAQDRQWIKMYNKLNVENTDDVANWLYKQRKLHSVNKLSEDKTILLERKGVEWDILKSTVYSLYKNIKNYYDEHKTLDGIPDELELDRLKTIITNNPGKYDINISEMCGGLEC